MNVSVAEAKARFSELLAKAHEGEEIIITKHGREFARLVAATTSHQLPRIGALKETMNLPDNLIEVLAEPVEGWEEQFQVSNCILSTPMFCSGLFKGTGN